MSPNQETGRRGNKVKGFVIHKPEASFQSALSWCNDIKSQVSYHYLIDKDGTIATLVPPENTAWHAGRVKNATWPGIIPNLNPNLYTIGISLAGFASEQPTQKQIANCANLISTLAKTFKIVLDKNSVITHNSITADKVCPGPFVSIDTLLYLSRLPQ